MKTFLKAVGITLLVMIGIAAFMMLIVLVTTKMLFWPAEITLGSIVLIGVFIIVYKGLKS